MLAEDPHALGDGLVLHALPRLDALAAGAVRVGGGVYLRAQVRGGVHQPDVVMSAQPQHCPGVRGEGDCAVGHEPALRPAVPAGLGHELRRLSLADVCAGSADVEAALLALDRHHRCVGAATGHQVDALGLEGGACGPVGPVPPPPALGDVPLGDAGGGRGHEMLELDAVGVVVAGGESVDLGQQPFQSVDLGGRCSALCGGHWTLPADSGAEPAAFVPCSEIITRFYCCSVRRPERPVFGHRRRGDGQRRPASVCTAPERSLEHRSRNRGVASSLPPTQRRRVRHRQTQETRPRRCRMPSIRARRQHPRRGRQHRRLQQEAHSQEKAQEAQAEGPEAHNGHHRSPNRRHTPNSSHRPTSRQRRRNTDQGSPLTAERPARRHHTPATAPCASRAKPPERRRRAPERLQRAGGSAREPISRTQPPKR